MGGVGAAAPGPPHTDLHVGVSRAAGQPRQQQQDRRVGGQALRGAGGWGGVGDGGGRGDGSGGQGSGMAGRPRRRRQHPAFLLAPTSRPPSCHSVTPATGRHGQRQGNGLSRRSPQRAQQGERGNASQQLPRARAQDHTRTPPSHPDPHTQAQSTTHLLGGEVLRIQRHTAAVGHVHDLAVKQQVRLHQWAAGGNSDRRTDRNSGSAMEGTDGIGGAPGRVCVGSPSLPGTLCRPPDHSATQHPHCRYSSTGVLSRPPPLLPAAPWAPPPDPPHLLPAQRGEDRLYMAVAEQGGQPVGRRERGAQRQQRLVPLGGLGDHGGGEDPRARQVHRRHRRRRRARRHAAQRQVAHARHNNCAGGSTLLLLLSLPSRCPARGGGSTEGRETGWRSGYTPQCGRADLANAHIKKR